VNGVCCAIERSRGEKWGGTDNQRERRARERKRRSDGGSAIRQAWSVRKSTLVWEKEVNSVMQEKRASTG
jgi:hypothetical protein